MTRGKRQGQGQGLANLKSGDPGGKRQGGRGRGRGQPERCKGKDVEAREKGQQNGTRDKGQDTRVALRERRGTRGENKGPTARGKRQGARSGLDQPAIKEMARDKERGKGANGKGRGGRGRGPEKLEP